MAQSQTATARMIEPPVRADLGTMPRDPFPGVVIAFMSRRELAAFAEAGPNGTAADQAAVYGRWRGDDDAVRRAWGLDDESDFLDH